MTGLLNYPVHVYSQLDKGSCFMIEVPVVEAPKVITPTVQAVPLKTKAYRILCLDNDETILEGMSSLLGRWGYEVLKPLNLNKHLKLFKREYSSLVYRSAFKQQPTRCRFYFAKSST